MKSAVSLPASLSSTLQCFVVLKLSIKGLAISVFTFSLIHLQHFMWMLKCNIIYLFSTFIENTFLSVLTLLIPLIENQVTTYFHIGLLISLVTVLKYFSIPHYLDRCHFIVSLQITAWYHPFLFLQMLYYILWDLAK